MLGVFVEFSEQMLSQEAQGQRIKRLSLA